MEKSLEEFGQQQLAVISPLAARSLALKGAAELVVVTDDAGLAAANVIKKDLNAHAKAVKELRLEITRPLDQVKDLFTAKEREILSPIEEGKAALATKVLAYEEKQERLRLIEQQRVEGIVTGIQLLFRPGMTETQIEQSRTAAKKHIAELPDEDKQISAIKLAFLTLSNRLDDRMNDLQIEKQRVQKKKLEDDATKIENEKRAIEAQKERQRLEQEQIEAEKAERAAEAARPKSGIREETKFEIVNPDEVPRHLCSPDEKKIRQAIKDGAIAIQLPGIHVYMKKGVR